MNIEYVAMGWGRTTNRRSDRGNVQEGGAHSNILQKLNVSFVPIENCTAIAKAYNNLTSDKQICAKTGRRGNIINNFFWHTRIIEKICFNFKINKTWNTFSHSQERILATEIVVGH